MGTISKEILSGSTVGGPIVVVETESPGTIIHTTGVSSTVIDEVWLYAINSDTLNRALVVEFGGTGSNNEIYIGIPPQSGLTVLIPGLCLQGNGSDVSRIRAYSPDSGSISLIGFVNRITP
jgi:hypothetical protein